MATDKVPTKKWIPANSRLKIDNVDCTGMAKIEALTIKQKPTSSQDSTGRGKVIDLGQVEFPDLVLSALESRAGDFYDWFQSFVIDGKNSDEGEKTETLQYLSADLKTTPFYADISQSRNYPRGPREGGVRQRKHSAGESRDVLRSDQLQRRPATGIRVAGLLIATAREFWRSRHVASTASPFPIPGNAAAARQTRRRLG
jgi:hypothetical protein